MLTFKEIAQLFEEIELRLIRSLKRNLGMHKLEEEAEGFEWTAWQAEKLRNLEKFRRENRSIMSEYTDVIDAETRQLMAEQFHEGEILAEKEAADSDVSAYPTSVPDNHFFGVNQQKMQKLITDITSLEKNAESAALRTMDDVYRMTVNRVQLEMGAGSMTLEKAVDIAVKDFLGKGIDCIVYKDGRRVNIADYVRMALRTTSTRAVLQGKSKSYRDMGYDTVLVSQYGMCSDTCLPYQGKVYIDDVFTEWNGEKHGDYGISQYCGKRYLLLSWAIKGGLFHPNCRHTISLWIEGRSKIPEPIDPTKIQKRAKAEQKQRELERKVRKYRREAEGLSDPKAVKEAKRKIHKAQKQVREHIEANKAFFRRDYDREKIYSMENTVPISADTENRIIPEAKPSTNHVPQEKAIEVEIKAPMVKGNVYADEKIPLKNRVDFSEESDIIELESKSDVNEAKHTDLFNDNDIPYNADITAEQIVDELNTTKIGRETLQDIENLPQRIKLSNEIKSGDIRGEEYGGEIVIYLKNCKNTLWAARTVIHEITHYKYRIGKCQWAEAVCIAQELKHARNRDYLTIDELRLIVKAVKEVYNDLNWRRGGYVNGRRKNH